MAFREDFPAAFPGYMQGPRLRTLFGAIGAQLDANAEQILGGRLQANPYAGGPTPDRSGAAQLADGRLIECEPFVLPIHADQRGIRIYPTESTLSKRIRLSQHLRLKQERGTHWGEIDHVRPYFSSALAYPTITIAFQTNEGTPAAIWYSVSASGARAVTRVSPSNMNLDGRPSLRTRWIAFLDMSATGYAAPVTYGGGDTYGDGALYGQGSLNPFTSAAQADVATMLVEWKSASSWCQGVVAVWPGATPFPTPGGTPTQDADGRWSLPHGANTWRSTVDPTTGKATRPVNFQWILDNPAP